jgi:hypothetical protein
MDKIKVSIIMPSIRIENWIPIINSIHESCKKYTWELIICGPYYNDSIKDIPNVKFIKDYGSPVRTSQIAASLAEGELITWTADDALFFPNALDRMIDIYEKGQSTVVVAKYLEGVNGTFKPLQPDSYFKINGSSWTESKYIPNDWWIFNIALMSLGNFNSLGGWDCEYQVTAMAHTDMAIRAQYFNYSVTMSDLPLLDCNHNQIDHGPIENTQMNYDLPLLWKKYRENDFNQNLVPNIYLDNWKKSPKIWTPRFSIK